MAGNLMGMIRDNDKAVRIALSSVFTVRRVYMTMTMLSIAVESVMWVLKDSRTMSLRWKKMAHGI